MKSIHGPLNPNPCKYNDIICLMFGSSNFYTCCMLDAWMHGLLFSYHGVGSAMFFLKVNLVENTHDSFYIPLMSRESYVSKWGCTLNK